MGNITIGVFTRSSMADEKLLENIRKDDRVAFDELYRRYWPALYDAAFKRLSDKQQAEDIVQEVFISLWERRRDLNIGKIVAYLHTAVKYSVLTYVTRHKDDVLSFYEPFEQMLTVVGTPDQHLIAKDLLALITDYAETLSDRKREIFLLRVKENLSTKEIAETLKVSQKSVQNQLGYALKDLKRYLHPLLLVLINIFF